MSVYVCGRCGWVAPMDCTCRASTDVLPEVDPPTIPLMRPVQITPPAPKPQPKPKPAPHLPAMERLTTSTANQLIAKLLGRTPA